jgi:putative intracellular protease/amidase
MVLTAHSQLGDTGEKTGFWLEEFTAPYYAFLDAGMDVVIAAPDRGEPPVDPRSTTPDNQTETTQRFRQDGAARAKLSNPTPIAEINSETIANELDALFFPGGHGPMWDLANNNEVTALVEAFAAHHKVIGAVCHGPAALVQAQGQDGHALVKGKRLTAFTNAEEKAVGLDQVVPFALETRLRDLGGDFSHSDPLQSHVVTDGTLVTGQNPPASAETAQAVIALLNPVPA